MENVTELETVVKLLDKIITSERKEIKDAFRELMIIAALTEPNADTAGPLRDLLDRLTQLEVEVASLKMNRSTDIFGPTSGPFSGHSWTDRTTSGQWNLGNFPNIISSGGSFSGVSGAITGSNGTLDTSFHGVADTSWQSLADTGDMANEEMVFQNPDFEKMWNDINSYEEEDK